jgi:hypothetical protein
MEELLHVKWIQTDPQTRDFIKWIESMHHGLVEIPIDQFDSFLDTLSTDIHYEEFDNDVEKDIESLEAEIEMLKRKVAVKQYQESKLRLWQNDKDREEIQLKRLIELKKDKFDALDIPFKATLNELHRVFDQIHSTTNDIEKELERLNFKSFDVDTFDSRIKAWEVQLDTIYHNSNTLHHQSTTNLSKKDEDEFLRLCDALCAAKQREFELSCWKVYYSSFLDDKVYESSQETSELEDLVKSLMKLDVNEWWKSHWQIPMEMNLLDQQISVQKQCLAQLEPFLASANVLVAQLNEINSTLQQESKHCNSHHFKISQTIQIMTDLVDKFKLVLVS